MLHLHILLTILTVFVCVAINFSEIGASPTSTTIPPTTHVVSFVKQKRTKTKNDEFSDFDFENINSKNLGEMSKGLLSNMEKNEPSNTGETSAADSLNVQQNTLENINELYDNSIQNGAPSHTIVNSSDITLNRFKQSISVLEPIKHLLNTVRDGGFNHTHTTHGKNHHQLVSSHHGNGEPHVESPAIETEEEREMVNEGTDLQFLEILGTFGRMIWGFIMNIQKLFAASSSNASASSSSSSSGGR